jgi:2-isopropylmalate synthase
LDALRVHLDIDLTIRDYTEHSVGEGKDAKAASYIEVVPANDRKSSQSWWGVGIDSDIAASGLRALLSAVNNAIGDRALPDLKLSVGFNGRSGQADIASAIVNSLGLELPRRLQSAFFEVVQRAARETGNISLEALTELFQSTYGFHPTGGPTQQLELGSFKLQHVGENGRQFVGDILIDGVKRSVTGDGNGPLSSTISALQQIIEGTFTVREYSEHSIGEGTEVVAASYVELTYEVAGSKKSAAWGVATDTDITSSGIKAVLTAASQIGAVLKKGN